MKDWHKYTNTKKKKGITTKKSNNKNYGMADTLPRTGTPGNYGNLRGRHFVVNLGSTFHTS